jgi:hypothetical protein
VYFVIAVPPFESGRSKATVTFPLEGPEVATGFLGALGVIGAATGVTGSEAVETLLVPAALVAVKVKV